MVKSAFMEKQHTPSEAEVNAVLGGALDAWDALCTHLEETYPAYALEWKHYGKASGWSLVVREKKKTLCYLTPMAERFTVSLSMSPKGRAAVAESGLPAEVVREVADSVNNPAGRTAEFAVRETAELESIRTLLALRHKF